MARKRRWHFTMGPLEHTSILWADDVYRGRLTDSGRVLLWAALGTGTMLLGGLLPHLIMLFGFCVSALVVALVMGAPFAPRLRMVRRMGAFPSVGDVVNYQVEVTNVGRRPARNVLVEERGLPAELRPAGSATVLDRIEPGASVLVPMRLQCERRGAYRLGRLQGSSQFPGGLVKVGRTDVTAQDTLLVYPRFDRLDGFELPHGRNYQPGGIAVASQVGESTEFQGLREWREGDRIRDVHWPAFARTGRLIVREYQEEYFVRLALVMDVEVRNWKDQQLLEKALSVTASMADALARREYIIDLVAAGTQVFQFQAGRALAHFDNILQVLAGVEEEDRLDVAALEAVLLPQAAQFSAIILVVMNWDERRAALVQALKQNGVAVRVMCVRPGVETAGLAEEERVML